MADREWVPEHLVDESFPSARAAPSDWIVGPAGDVWLISAGDEDEMDPEDIDGARRRLRPGETLPFLWTQQDLGSFEVLIQPDGSYQTNGCIPSAATHFWVKGDTDTIADDLASFCKCYADGWSADGLPRWVTVEAYAWAELPIPHRLVVTAEGARFEAMERAHG